MSDSEFENRSVTSKICVPLDRNLGVKKEGVEGAFESGLGGMEEAVPLAKAVRERRKLSRAGVWVLVKVETTPLVGRDHISGERQRLSTVSTLLWSLFI